LQIVGIRGGIRTHQAGIAVLDHANNPERDSHRATHVDDLVDGFVRILPPERPSQRAIDDDGLSPPRRKLVEWNELIAVLAVEQAPGEQLQIHRFEKVIADIVHDRVFARRTRFGAAGQRLVVAAAVPG